jgi:3D (Asp-Asp-Asp) domain-containing protein
MFKGHVSFLYVGCRKFLSISKSDILIFVDVATDISNNRTDIYMYTLNVYIT